MKKEIEFRDLNKIKYNIMGNFKDCLRDTNIYRKLNNDGAVEYLGELYTIDMFAHDPSVCVTHVDTQTIAYSDTANDKEPQEDPTIYKNCRCLALKIMDDWMKETKRKHYGIQEEIKR